MSRPMSLCCAVAVLCGAAAAELAFGVLGAFVESAEAVCAAPPRRSGVQQADGGGEAADRGYPTQLLHLTPPHPQSDMRTLTDVGRPLLV